MAHQKLSSHIVLIYNNKKNITIFCPLNKKWILTLTPSYTANNGFAQFAIVPLLNREKSVNVSVVQWALNEQSMCIMYTCTHYT